MADLHLGYRQFQRLTPVGRNQREVDVRLSFVKAVTMAIQLEPDLVVVAGDVFHKPRPSNWVMHEAAEGFRLLTDRKIPVCIVAGNHDQNKLVAEGQVLDLLRLTGCHVATRGPAITNPAPLVFGVPEGCWAKGKGRAFAPDSILLLHGEIQGVLPFHSEHAIPLADIEATGWSYVALGHWHQRLDLWPNGGYSGSLDYVSSDIWSEARSGIPKGFIEYDTETRRRTFHRIETRPVVDLPPIDASGWAASKLTEALVAVAEYHGLPEGAIARQRVLNVERTEYRMVNHKAVKKASERLLALQIQPSPPPSVVSPPDGFASWEAWEAWCRDEVFTPVVPGDTDDTAIAADDTAIAAALQRPTDDLTREVNDLYGLNAS